MFKISALLFGICFWGCCSTRNETKFVPLKEYTISCFIEKGKNFGDLKITIKNITNKKISFSKPRVITAKEFMAKEPQFVNALKIILDNKKGKTFEVLAFTYSDEKVINEIITLEPKQKSYMRLSIKDIAVERRCNLVPFSDFFEKGKEEFQATLSIVCIGKEQYKEAVSSNSIPFVKLRRKKLR